MLFPLLLTTFISSSLAAPATFFTITGLDVYDQHRPTTSHLISFSISNPNAVYEQGGSDVANCTLEWYVVLPKTLTSPCERPPTSTMLRSAPPLTLPQVRHLPTPNNLLHPLQHHRPRMVHPSLPDLQLLLRLANLLLREFQHRCSRVLRL